MSRELVKYHIRATKKPARTELLAATVIVVNELGETGYCYIGFSPELIYKVGNLLTQGLTKNHPAYLRVTFYQRTKLWLVTAKYVDDSQEVLLWKTELKPKWLNFYRARTDDGPPDS